MNAPAATQGQFDFILGVSNRELLRVDEVCRRLGVGRDYVYGLIAEGSLEIHRREGVERSAQLITRRSMLLWLAKTASYRSEDTIETLIRFIGTLSRAERTKLQARLQALPLPKN